MYEQLLRALRTNDIAHQAELAYQGLDTESSFNPPWLAGLMREELDYTTV